MAVGRSLHAGGSFGRVQAGIIWALGNWQEFDAWCCIKSVDPLELPAYRFYNLIVWFLKEGKSEEQLELLELELRRADFDKHPLHIMTYSHVKPNSIVNRAIKDIEENDNSASDPKNQYVPSWWRGDHQNYNVAKQVMKTLPT